MIVFTIDEMVPCLKNVETGEIYETEVIRLRRKSFLSKFNSHTGWYVNWSKFDHDTEIYAGMQNISESSVCLLMKLHQIL